MSQAFRPLTSLKKIDLDIYEILIGDNAMRLTDVTLDSISQALQVLKPLKSIKLTAPAG